MSVTGTAMVAIEPVCCTAGLAGLLNGVTSREYSASMQASAVVECCASVNFIVKLAWPVSWVVYVVDSWSRYKSFWHCQARLAAAAAALLHSPVLMQALKTTNVLESRRC